MKDILCAVTVFFLLVSCSGKKKLTSEERNSYETEINAWHAKRVEDLKRPDGWLNLVGLHWLTSEKSSFGSGDENSIVFPEGKIAKEAGFFLVKNNSVLIQVAKGVSITKNGKPVTNDVIFYPDSVKSAVLKSGDLQWTIIRRDQKLGIRLRDLNSDELKNFKGIERFPVDPEYRLEATFKKYDSTHIIPITNVLGQTNDQPSPGALVFTLGGKEYQLDVLDGGHDEYFVIFADATTGKETYTGGRFVYVKKEAADGKTFLDFNKAYNPPCVFTPYATCPLPPKQNVLEVEVRAGEKNYEH